MAGARGEYKRYLRDDEEPIPDRSLSRYNSDRNDAAEQANERDNRVERMQPVEQVNVLQVEERIGHPRPQSPENPVRGDDGINEDEQDFEQHQNEEIRDAGDGEGVEEEENEQNVMNIMEDQYDVVGDVTGEEEDELDEMEIMEDQEDVGPDVRGEEEGRGQLEHPYCAQRYESFTLRCENLSASEEELVDPHTYDSDEGERHLHEQQELVEPAAEQEENEVERFINDDDQQELPEANPSTHVKLRQAIQTETFTAPISTPVNASPAEALLMTLAMAEKNKLTYKAFVDSARLVNSLFLSPVIPNSAYLLDSLLNSSAGIQRFFYCGACSYSFGNRDHTEEKVLQCPKPNCNFLTKISDLTKATYFALYLLPPQIQLLLFDKKIRDKLLSPKELVQMCQPGVLRDLYDGECYKNFASSLPENATEKVISFVISTDGSPLFNSSTFSIWPFFLSINELPPQLRMSHLLLGGLWFGNKKPHMDLFLKPIVDHLHQLSQGFRIQIDGEETAMKAFAIACCVDSGARGPVQGLNTHSGYYSCNWCEIPGEYGDHKVIFPFPEDPPRLRTHASVVQHANENLEDGSLSYVCGVQYLSCLANLPMFNIVDGMVLDYAHNVPFGIARTFLNEWLGNTNKGFYIGAPDDIKELDRKMMELTPPIEVRKPVRKISDNAHWSAREYDSWTVAYSLPVLSGLLPLKYLVHWGYLVQGYFLLCRQSVSFEDVNNARQFFLHFARDAETLYGKNVMSYNLHLLGHHMAENAARWGPLWAISTFCFESGIKDIKGLLHAQRGVPHQVQRALNYQQAHEILRSMCGTPKTEVFESGLASKPNKMTKYMPAEDCVLIGSSVDFVPNNEEQYLLNNFNIDIAQCSAYSKIISKKCVYTTSDIKSRKKFNNSCALTKNNEVIILKKFIHESSTGKVYAFYVLVYTETFCRVPEGVRIAHQDHCIRTITSIGQRLHIMSVKELKIVCVFTKMNGKQYVSEFPNIMNTF